MRYLVGLLTFLIFIPAAFANPPTNMKEISYQGGIISFSVPENWVEEGELDATGVYYKNAQNSGTLRLNVFTFESAQPELPIDVYAELLKNIQTDTIEEVGNGNVIATSIKRSTEQGQPITLYWWYLAQPILPNHLRLAYFSYTILTYQENDSAVKNEIKMLAESIKNAKFSPPVAR